MKADVWPGKLFWYPANEIYITLAFGTQASPSIKYRLLVIAACGIDKQHNNDIFSREKSTPNRFNDADAGSKTTRAFALCLTVFAIL